MRHDSVTVEILDNNIGYLKITGDSYLYNEGKIFEEHFGLLSDVDALIIDLRLADGATIALTQQMISYFVQPGITIGNVKFNKNSEALTSVHTEGFDRFKENFPLYIINSSFVSGAWEFFGYTLKHFDKAIIVGEDSMGVGHIAKLVRVSDTISIKMNHAIITHPISNESWENDGVVPDYFFKGDDAFRKAYDLALIQISEN